MRIERILKKLSHPPANWAKDGFDLFRNHHSHAGGNLVKQGQQGSPLLWKITEKQ
jgi:hypothetical protein